MEIDQIIAVAVVVGVLLYKLFSKSRHVKQPAPTVELPATRHAGVQQIAQRRLHNTASAPVRRVQTPPVPARQADHSSLNNRPPMNEPETDIQDMSLQELRRAFIVGELLRPKFRD